MPLNNVRIAKFGVFEVDFHAAELRKNGTKLRLQGQPFQVLAILLEHAGEPVTREELREKLWASDTFVDFDHSLNTAINKVREALGDSASSPRFVETLARRGYRFIAPVQTVAEPKSKSDEHATSLRPEPAVPPNSLHPELQIPLPNRRLARGLFALIQVMYLIFYIVALFRLHAIDQIADAFLAPHGAMILLAVVMVTAGAGIPLRCYLISAVGFDHKQTGDKFRRIFPFLLGLDQAWAAAPFLMIHELGVGGAFAICAALLYVPFSERTLIRMAYVGKS